MRFSRIPLAIIGLLLAWQIGPPLVNLLVTLLPKLGGFLLYLAPDVSGKDFQFWFRFIISLVLFWLFYKLAGAFFGFLSPKAQQFGTTKFVRRMQGLCGEILILLIFALGIAWPYLLFTDKGRDEVSERAVEMYTVPDDRPTGFLKFHRDDPKRAQVKADVRELLEHPFTTPVGLQFPIYLGVLIVGWREELVIGAAFYAVLGRRMKRLLAIVYSRFMRFLHKGRFGMGGSARFCGLVEEWKMRWRPWIDALYWLGPADYDPSVDNLVTRFHKKLVEERVGVGGGGLFMGRSLYSRLLHVELKDDRHMLTIAGSRGGKGISVIIPNLLTYDGSVLCIDPKGENAKITARRRRQMGQDVHIVDPFHIVTDKEGAFLNPLETLDPNSLTIREDLSVVADALVVHDPDHREGSHWEDGARTVLTGLMAQLITDEKYRVDGPPKLGMIRDLLALPQKELLALWVDMAKNRGAGDAARDAASRIKRGIDTDEVTNIISNADKHSEWLSYPSMTALLSKSTFRFSDLKNKPTTIYLVVPPEYLDVHRRFLRLFINLALNEMPKGGPSKIPVLMILDEFLQLGKMNQVERAFRLLAGYNFTVWPFVQELGSMKSMYKEGLGAFIANSRAVQVFSSNDPDTVKYVSEEIGTRSMKYIAGMSDNSLRITPLRDPKEVGLEIEREGGLQYVLRAGKPAMVLDRVKYFEDQSLASPENRFSQWLYRKFYPFAGLYDGR